MLHATHSSQYSNNYRVRKQFARKFSRTECLKCYHHSSAIITLVAFKTNSPRIENTTSRTFPLSSLFPEPQRVACAERAQLREEAAGSFFFLQWKIHTMQSAKNVAVVARVARYYFHFLLVIVMKVNYLVAAN